MRTTPAVALAFLALAVLPACAPLVQRAPAPAAPIEACRAQFDRVDAAVAKAGVRDAEARRVDGFPYLRVDRLLASFAGEVDDAVRFAAWRAHLRELDRAARAVELSNLGPAGRAGLGAPAGSDAGAEGLLAQLDVCAQTLMQADDAQPARAQDLRARARVPDDYDAWKRVAGVYWLSRLPFSVGVAGYRREVMATFAQPLATLSPQGALRTYAPVAADDAAAEPPPGRDALGIPRPTPAQRDALFARHAPLWIVDEAGPDDRIGRVVLGEGKAVVDAAEPVVYRRLAYTRFDGTVLMQLVYAAWFPARPRDGAIDLLAGHLDSVVWRVTLDRDGAPLLYDTMHGCGCYHQFFPTERLRLLPQRTRLEEGALVPQRLAAVDARQRVALRIAARSHYLQRVLPDAPPVAAATSYLMRPDSDLRVLPAGGDATRSAFGEDGIVRGSERGERYLFWPMGVREPGAMRQWGRHATAFLGRRHFDDAHLIERYFARSAH